MPSNSAEYMRAYRARQKWAKENLEATVNGPKGIRITERDRELILQIGAGAQRKIEELEAEVAQLKRELASRPRKGDTWASVLEEAFLAGDPK